MTEVSLDVSETERLRLRPGRWFDWFWGRGDRSFWRWPVYSLSLPHQCPWLPPTWTPPLTTVKERDLKKNITLGGQGPSGDPRKDPSQHSSERPVSRLDLFPAAALHLNLELSNRKQQLNSPWNFNWNSRQVSVWICFDSAENFYLKLCTTASTLQQNYWPPCLQAHPLFFVFFLDHMTNGFLHTCMGVHTPGPPHCTALCRALLNSHRDLKIPTRQEIPPPFRSKRAALQRHPNNKPLSNSESSQTIYNWSIRELFFPDRLLCLGVETSERWRWLMASSHMWKNGLYHEIKHTWGPTMKPMYQKFGGSQTGGQFFETDLTANKDQIIYQLKLSLH